MTRFFDVLTSAFLIVFFMPILMLLALSLTLCCGGRVIDNGRGPRVGAPHVLRFATSVADGDRAYGRMACALCRFLERSRLSTLPELLNVLQGDLTIFGDFRRRPVLLGGPDTQPC